jgi:hypothetical protein
MPAGDGRRGHHPPTHQRPQRGAIAKALGMTVAEVNEAIDRWADSAITDKSRKHTLALELAQLDELQAVFYRRALEGDVQWGALVTKIISQRCCTRPRLRCCRLSRKCDRRKRVPTRSSGHFNALLIGQKKDPITH